MALINFLLSLLLPGLILWYFFIRKNARLNLIKAFTNSHAFKYGRLSSIAKGVAQGHKPWGEAWDATHGSAYLMTPDQVIESENGINIEQFGEDKTSKEKIFTLLGISTFKDKSAANINTRPGHILTIAPTRSGKGVSAVIPNLLTYTGSMVVNDIKGENYAVTSRFRKMIGQKVVKFSPFEKDTDFWNPMDLIANNEDAWEDIHSLANLLLPIQQTNDPFWDNEARNFLSGVLMHIHHSCKPEQQTLCHARHLLTQDNEEFEALVAEMAASDQILVRRAANTFIRADEKVRSGILSTLNAHMSIWDSPRLQHMTSKSSLNLADIKNTPTTVYFSIPPEKLETYATVIRVFMGMLINHLTRDRKKGQVPTLFMLDEFPALGRIKIIDEAISYLAGYGVNLWIFAQDLKQINAVYANKAQSIIANCHIKQFFGVSDYETAEYISKLSGQTTVPTAGYSGGIPAFSSQNKSISLTGQPLISTQEALSLDSKLQLLFYQGQNTIISNKINYLVESFFFKTDGEYDFDPNPYHA